MEYRHFGPSALLSPVPVVMVTCTDEQGHDNILTAAWCGTICTKPSMVALGVKKERYSHDLIVHRRECVLNLTSVALVKHADYCGVRSGRDVDKFEKTGLHRQKTVLSVPAIAESPVHLCCRLQSVTPLGSHDLFLLETVDVALAETLFASGEAPDFTKAGLVCYAHGEYFALGRRLGFFGYSVASEQALKRRMR